MTINIKKQIALLGEDYIKRTQERFTVGEVVPYPYQVVAYAEIAKRLSNYEHPFFVKASVSAGKTIIFAMVAKQCQKMGLKMLVLARQGEIVDQDSEEIDNFGVTNSIFSASLGIKSCYFPIVVGSEGTVANGLNNELADFVPHVIGIDECHQVDWEDLAQAIDGKETMEQMREEKGKIIMEGGISLIGNDGKPLLGTKRSQYTIVIMEMMRRCKEVHGHDLRIFGMTGSEFRGVVPILVENPKALGFWRERVTDIDTNYLIEFGSVVPTIFGSTDGAHYDLDKFKASSEDGVQDFTEKDMKAMEDEILHDKSLTQRIMQMVAKKAEERNAVLITCAGVRHCKEAAAALPPGSTYAIITGDTDTKTRKKILDDVRSGKIKYTFQVMALTTGVNVPNWDFSVILRKIGSLTLLIQLLGRGMRLLKSWQVAEGMVKQDHLVWDFAGTMDELGQLYFDPILEQAQFQKRFENGKDPKTCPKCGCVNSFYARRCVNVIDGERCDHFWTSQICEDQVDERTGKILVKGCGAENDVVARVCRCCDVSLVDPNLKLSGKAYTKNDWYEVKNFEVTLTKNQKGVIYKYTLINDDGDEFKAYEKFFPESDSKICGTLWKTKGVLPHVSDPKMRRYFIGMKNAIKIVQYAHHIAHPVRVTHRRNQKKEDIISRKDFGMEDIPE
ncbi:DNA helicase [Escherichia phage LeonhardEuler]|uniref:DNA helicase n=1 Tax=Escherichia phage LeonhardEuler TaxID=2851977 RepID=A0AAE7VW19_9CAUD|nr:helicase-related protein [Pseudomonas aeruginosa]MDQ4166649.1 helicase-related protein [Pseudomonas aeruginosa]MDQ4209602.1 helicase-related protein [Pseudomonas aeruginosa]MDQ4334806.1 helicase-related protein [Pseudomonas aeruginosa]QXV82469.1 DNA helicase [Escherichia phage LeonhardEuler]